MSDADTIHSNAERSKLQFLLNAVIPHTWSLLIILKILSQIAVYLHLYFPQLSHAFSQKSATWSSSTCASSCSRGPTGKRSAPDQLAPQKR